MFQRSGTFGPWPWPATRGTVNRMSAVTYVVDIGPEDCADLLASSSLGRLGVIVDGRPEIYPVNHVYDRETGCVVFPSNPRTKLRAALELAVGGVRGRRCGT